MYCRIFFLKKYGYRSKNMRFFFIFAKIKQLLN